MPAVFYAADVYPEAEVFVVTKNNTERQAYVLERRPDELYVHYINTDKRLDEWVPESIVRQAEPHETATAETNGTSRKRKRNPLERELLGVRADAEVGSGSKSGLGGDSKDEEGTMITEEEYDIEHHKQITAKRNFDKVNFGKWQIKTWYFSPYPLTESEIEEAVSTPTPHGGPSAPGRPPGVARSTLRAHGRTSDILARGLGRSHGADNSILWVCDKCFKYMSEGVSWELHVKKCTRKHPPGRKVYQRGAHIIWEVDGAKEKLYCQNLSLFGKLFIDVKTLFFDCDNFLFYILTDADSQRDHVIGFFSKEKVSFDDYNLACIVVLPPYQRNSYGMLMIEFSYELSRRQGKLGTPERPLSDLGLRSYLAYWVATIIRFFRRLLTVLPPGTEKVVTSGSAFDVSDPLSPAREQDDPSGVQIKVKRKKNTKGWDGEQDPAIRATVQSTTEIDPAFSSLRTIETIANPDGSCTSHVMVRCTLADIARATGLRMEDAAFAMNECGLLSRRLKPDDDESKEVGEETEDGESMSNLKTSTGTVEETVVVSRELVEQIAKERRVKKMCMDLAHVLL
ncbi:MYST (SAS/MOZ) family protein [Abortiporus biennis]